MNPTTIGNVNPNLIKISDSISLDSSEIIATSKAVKSVYDTLESLSTIGIIFDFKYTDHTLNNVSWVCADTYSWLSGDVYVAAYDKLLNEYGSNGSTTKEENGITYKETVSGYKIADASFMLDIKNLYSRGIDTWFYVLDTTNKRFKLPRKHNESPEQKLYFYVGDYKPTALSQTAGIKSETFNKKLDSDFRNAKIGEGLNVSDDGTLSAVSNILYYESVPSEGLPTNVPNGTLALIDDNKPVTEDKIIQYAQVPIGSIVWNVCSAENIPNGYLLCNGSVISRTAYSELFAIIGTKFGTGDGKTTFNLPNLMGKFLDGSSVASQFANTVIPLIRAISNFK